MSFYVNIFSIRCTVATIYLLCSSNLALPPPGRSRMTSLSARMLDFFSQPLSDQEASSIEKAEGRGRLRPHRMSLVDCC